MTNDNGQLTKIKLQEQLELIEHLSQQMALGVGLRPLSQYSLRQLTERLGYTQVQLYQWGGQPAQGLLYDSWPSEKPAENGLAGMIQRAIRQQQPQHSQANHGSGLAHLVFPLGSPPWGALAIQAPQGFSPEENAFLRSVAALLGSSGRDTTGMTTTQKESYAYNYNDQTIEASPLLPVGIANVWQPGQHQQGQEDNEQWWAVPLVGPGKVLGVLGITAPAENSDWTTEEWRLLEEVSQQAAQAVAHAQLLAQMKARTAETEQLYQISRSLVEAQTLNQVYALIIETIKAHGVDRVSISLLDRDAAGEIETVWIAATWDRDPHKQSAVGTRFSGRNYGLVQAFAKPPFHPVICEDLSDVANVDPRMDDGFRRLVHEDMGAITLFSAPMFLGSDYKGVLSIHTRQPHHYSDYEIRLYQMLADQAIIVIENHILLERMRQERDRVAQLSERREQLAELGEALIAAETETEVYEACVTILAATGPSRGVWLFRFEPDGGIRLVAGKNSPNPLGTWPQLEIGLWLAEKDLGITQNLAQGETVLWPNIAAVSELSETEQQQWDLMQIAAVVAVPLQLKLRVAGFVVIGWAEAQAEEFPAEQVQLYQDMVRRTSDGLEYEQLFEAAQYRARLLQATAEIAAAATASLDLAVLLPQTVNLIRDRLGFYHVAIFLVDEYQKYAFIQAATDAVGQQMVARRHKLAVGGSSVVGQASRTEQPYVARDVRQEAGYFNNPLLPNTRAEMALPLIARGKVIGVLDVHSETVGAFTESDLTILQSMSSQLANAIEAAQALQESQAALQQVNQLHAHYLRQEWGGFLREKQGGVSYRLEREKGEADAKSANEVKRENLQLAELREQVLTSRQTLVAKAITELTESKLKENGLEPVRLVTPLRLHEEAAIGVLDLLIDQPHEAWDEDNRLIIEAVAAQAAQAIETARLFEQTQSAREEAEALYEVVQTLLTAKDETTMYGTVLAALLSALGLRQGGIYMLERNAEGGQHFRRVTFRQGGKWLKEEELFLLPEDWAQVSELIELRHPVMFEQLSDASVLSFWLDILIQRGTVSLLLVPVSIEGQLVGLVTAEVVGQPYQFSEREINLARAMVDQLAITVQNHRLLGETKRRAVLLQTNADVSRVATSILDLDKMLYEAATLIKERFGFYQVQIFIMDELQQYAVLSQSTNSNNPTKYKIAAGSAGLIGQVTEGRQSLVVRGTGLGADLEIGMAEQVQAELAIPLQVAKALLGVLDVQSTSPDAFTREDIATLESLGAQLAIAIQNARRFREQEQVAARLREVDKLKTQFLANMSHELRTPLNSIIGFSRVILKGIDGPLTELQKADLTSIYNSGQHLLGLINNILDLSKIEAGKMEINQEETEVEPIIKQVMSTAIALVKDKPVKLVSEVPDGLPTVWADATRIRQVILNLVSNACKFTDEGDVTIRASAGKDKVTISVVDSGIGIPADKLNSVFEEFTQVDASTTRKVGGTGLGLPISRHFVEMHKGQIWVESEFGQGSIFSFAIPIYQGEQHSDEDAVVKTEAEIAASEENKRVIVAIDPDPNVISLYQRFLQHNGYELIGLHDGEDIVHKIKHHAPIAILLEVQIPDGWTILSELKDNAITKTIPIVICSTIKDKNRGFHMGAADYLVKPIVEKELLRSLRNVESLERGKIKVLIIDDHVDDVLLFRRILEAQDNYKIIEANNGREGLKIVETMRPDLIICDLNMPEMNGFRVVESLRSSEKTKHIPIIIVSAQELSISQHKYLAEQVQYLLNKGVFTEKELLEDVRQILIQNGKKVE